MNISIHSIDVVSDAGTPAKLLRQTRRVVRHGSDGTESSHDLAPIYSTEDGEGVERVAEGYFTAVLSRRSFRLLR